MIIAYLDVLFNLPVLLISLITSILAGKNSPLNYPYMSWKNVHEGEGGSAPGLSLGSVLQVPASTWGTEAWGVFDVKWDEWLYVLHAIVFFCVFGTTPEMRRYYRSMACFVPEHFGFKGSLVSEAETMSDVQFNSNPALRTESFSGTHR